MNEIISDSGIPIKPVYRAEDAPAPQPDPGQYPYTRGVYPTMYRGRLWTMRQYAGFASARESNARYRYLLERGQTGLSVAFDLPTQLGLDSDDERAEGEVGKVGVAIDSLEDMAALFDGIPLDTVTTSMTINAPAAVLLLLYELVAERQGVALTAVQLPTPDNPRAVRVCPSDTPVPATRSPTVLGGLVGADRLPTADLRTRGF